GISHQRTSNTLGAIHPNSNGKEQLSCVNYVGIRQSPCSNNTSFVVVDSCIIVFFGHDLALLNIKSKFRHEIAAVRKLEIRACAGLNLYIPNGQNAQRRKSPL
ncbi:hypothetical protein, partial [Photobacterium sanguinicancri]